jgi:adenosylcobyric acid synthase
MTGRPRTLVVWGTNSGAGKSLLATALCRWAARRGLDVAPFKAQNMSNNARVVPHPDGGCGEIGSAQYWQALAARVPPTVDMNPVLLKPERDTASQVVVHGRVAPELAALPWRERSATLASAARESLERLLARHELVVVEGAGSPAEINLADCDYVNLAAARWARAAGPLRALLVCDIDRGGAFAHLYGTWRLLPDDLRGHLAGFVLNKFRGDAALLAPGPQQLEALTGVPLAGVLPMWRDHGLPDEDAPAAFDAPGDSARSDTTAGGLRIAVVAPPGISNLDEFEPLRHLNGVRLQWARSAADLAGAELVVLPGSKATLADLAWLRAQRLDSAITAHAAAGRPLLGVCGGLQMLGQTLQDPDGVDGGGVVAAAPGLGLLPLVTRFSAPKRLCRQRTRFAALLAPPWQALAGVEVEGYEIRCGRTELAAGAAADAVLHASDGSPIGWQRGPALGLYLHGLFENPAVIARLFGGDLPSLEQRFDALAEAVDRHLGAGLGQAFE